MEATRINFSLNLVYAIDRAEARHYAAVIMSQADLDQLCLAYKQAVDKWVGAIREEEALATPDHSIVAMEKWDDAHFKEHDAHSKVTAARDAYKDALRRANYSI